MAALDVSSIDPALERVRVAYHEAGHALAAWKLGIPFVEVSVLRLPGHGEVAKGLEVIEQQRGTTSMHIAAAVFLLAGQCSQTRRDPRYSSFGCDQDRFDARVHANKLSVDLNMLEAQAAELIRVEWHRVQALALVLLDGAVITGADAAGILEGAIAADEGPTGG